MLLKIYHSASGEIGEEKDIKGINFYLLNVASPDQAILKKILSDIPKDIQLKVSKSRFMQDQWRLVLSDFLLKHILSSELGVTRNKIEIKMDKYGKPFLPQKNRHFNLSHARNVVVLATDIAPIGIDIEYVRPFDDLEHLLSQFSKEEQEEYDSKPNEERVDFFYDLWTLKESYLKAIGKGLSCPLQSFSIRVTKNGADLLRGVDTDIEWHFKRYEIENHYKCAICAKHKNFPERAKIIEVGELLKFYL